MNRRIYYLHPAKTGGQSVNKVLRDLGVGFLPTHAIKFNQQTLDLLESNQPLIIHGHIGSIPVCESQEESLLFKKIILTIYNDFNLIVPTRNPANLLQSWMHYAKNRANNIISSSKFSSSVEGKDGGMISKMLSLKQNAIKFDNQSGKIIKGEDFPVIDLKEQDEESNLFLFANHLQNRKNDLGVLNPLTMSLMYPHWHNIVKNILDKQTFRIAPPLSNSSRYVHYYDCESISSDTLKMLDQEIHPQFSGNLVRSRVNKSMNKNLIQASHIQSIVQMSKKLVPHEWSIYEHAVT